MKNTIFFSALIIGLSCLFSTNTIIADEVTADSIITAVTVYKDRALVTREAKLAVTQGETRLIFDFLPENIDTGSFQVKGSGRVVLQDIEYKTIYYSSIPDEKIHRLTEQLKNIEDSIEDKADAVRRAKEEKNFLQKIITTVTTTSENRTAELDPEKWIKMVNFHSDKSAELDKQIRRLERENRDLTAEQTKVNTELQSLSAGRSLKKNQAVVVLQAKHKTDTRISLSYLVHGPSWYPEYDIRVNSADKNMQLYYNARVNQNTGEDWNKVKLQLSTARVNIYGKQPDLPPWYIYLNPRNQELLYEQQKRTAEAPMRQMYNMFDASPETGTDESAGNWNPAITIPTATVEAGATAVLFNVSGSHTIASDNSSHKVSVFNRNFPAYFRYSAVPKAATYAFLKARATNDTEFPLLSGTAKIFLDGAFVANSTIDNIAPGDEFWTFLGVDEGISIDYKLVNRETVKGGVFDKKDGSRYQYRITVTNKKQSAAEIVIWDQLPIAGEQDITVTLVKPEYDKEDSTFKKNDQDFLEWLYELKPGAKQEIDFEFTVEYPKGSYVHGL
jgi:uncharacterized protein (TIGR02231 family)